MNAKKKGCEDALASNMAFTHEVLSRFLMVPELFLREYAAMGLSDQEFIRLLHLLLLDRNASSFGLADVENEFACNAAEAEALLRPLILRGFVVPAAETPDAYSLDGLWNELYEHWVYQKSCGKKKPEAKDKQALQLRHQEDPVFGALYQTFEKEFINGISPLQAEKLSRWLYKDKIPADMIEEALKRAVLQGKVSFSYIDSILLNWQKQNFRTLADVEARDQHPAAPKPSGQKSKRKAKETEYNSIYDKIPEC